MLYQYKMKFDINLHKMVSCLTTATSLDQTHFTDKLVLVKVIKLHTEWELVDNKLALCFICFPTPSLLFTPAPLWLAPMQYDIQFIWTMVVTFLGEDKVFFLKWEKVVKTYDNDNKPSIIVQLILTSCNNGSSNSMIFYCLNVKGFFDYD